MHDAGSTPSDRKAEIVRRLQAGDRGAEIAADLGVTRQYVSLVKQRLEREGADAVMALSQRGRPRHRPLLPDEADSLRKHVAAGRPGASGSDALWTAAEVLTWFKRTHARPLSVHQLRKFCADHGLFLAISPEALGWTEEEWVAKGPPSSAEAIPPRSAEPAEPPARRTRRRTAFESMSEDDVVDMMRANAEVARRMQEARAKAAAVSEAPATPARLGPKLGRNDPCPLDSTKKFKRCCGATGATRCLRTTG